MRKATNEELREIYNDIPEFYDRANALISFFQDVKWRAELIATVREYCPKPKIILDVGSGKGELSYVVSKLMNANIVMLDYAENMLKNSMVNGDKVLGSFYNLPFRDGAFDAVVSSFALHAADNIEEVVKEMVRVSRKVVGVIAMGKSDNFILRNYVAFYLRFIQPYLAALVGAKPLDYKYIYYIYKKIPTNSQLKEIVKRNMDLKIFKEKTLGAVYIFVGVKKEEK
ncbi:class I SAM-dependent methyltransferase [Stygiolobus azoricus]|uniref:Methyltransferase domain-containing protein n=1 Tax=Stygiolobus azoricus TaxID=41675 RepID=A0A650CQQ1_9CREN|nr:class I SAM-dependent methyltransferase [Stygiolobus azoricus]QGR19807.1 methyltransferase domain-containing protein [Stygiolobus azoricus]